MRGGFGVVLSAVAGLAVAGTVSAQTVAPAAPGPCAAAEPLLAAANLAAVLTQKDIVAADVDQAVARAPDCSAARLRKAEIDLARGRGDDARREASAVIARDPNMAEAYAVRALAILPGREGADRAQMTTRTHAAIADFSRAIDLGLTDPLIFVARSEAYDEIDDKTHAMADMDRAVAADPGNPRWLIVRGQSYETSLRDYDKAIADYKAARDKSGADDMQMGLSYRSAVRAYQEKGDLDGAIAFVGQAVSAYPKDPQYLRMRAELYADHHDDAHAIADLSAVIAVDAMPDDFIRRARAYAETGDYPRGLADTGEALQGNPGDAEAYVVRGQIDERKGDVATAIADYDRGLALRPGSGWGLAANAACWTRATHNVELDKALAACDALIEAFDMDVPMDRSVHDSRGFVQFRRGEYAAAVTDYTTALETQPKLASSLFGRALAEQKLGQADAAKADFAAARAAKPDIDAEFKTYGVTAE